ncbi:MAG: DUF58 domain-containing protein [Acidobacteriota bacterium]|nr:DUF58 domain-containing protein [Acidobacteriota bacterium]
MRWRSLSTALRKRIRYKITWGGALFLLTLGLVSAAAALSANNLLFLIVAAMLATLLVSGLVSRLCLAGLELELVLPEHISARRNLPARLVLRNLKRWMPSFSIQVAGVPEDGQAPILRAPIYFPIVPGGAVLEESAGVFFTRRGVHSRNLFAFSTKFPFGFLEKNARVTLRKDTLVYPSVETKPGFENLLAGIAGEIEMHLRGGGRDFYRIRPYQAFESARHVDWKSTAHTGDLQVREFARERQRTVEIFLDRGAPRKSSPGWEEWFERAVECSAFLCWHLQETGLRFRSQHCDIRLPEDGDVYTILKFLALVSPQASKIHEEPADESNLQIVLSADPQRFLDAGWTPARVLGPGDLSVDGAAESAEA